MPSIRDLAGHPTRCYFPAQEPSSAPTGHRTKPTPPGLASMLFRYYPFFLLRLLYPVRLSILNAPHLPPTVLFYHSKPWRFQLINHVIATFILSVSVFGGKWALSNWIKFFKGWKHTFLCTPESTQHQVRPTARAKQMLVGGYVVTVCTLGRRKHAPFSGAPTCRESQIAHSGQSPGIPQALRLIIPL